MAKAPTPGVGKRAAATSAAQRTMTITVREESHTIAPFNLTLDERLAVRKATGMPFEAFMGEIEPAGATKVGLDTIQILWWLARRSSGESGLTFDTAMNQWPDDLEFTEFAVVLNEPDAEADDPEA